MGAPGASPHGGDEPCAADAADTCAEPAAAAAAAAAVPSGDADGPVGGCCCCCCCVEGADAVPEAPGSPLECAACSVDAFSAPCGSSLRGKGRGGERGGVRAWKLCEGMHVMHEGMQAALS